MGKNKIVYFMILLCIIIGQYTIPSAWGRLSVILIFGVAFFLIYAMIGLHNRKESFRRIISLISKRSYHSKEVYHHRHRSCCSCFYFLVCFIKKNKLNLHPDDKPPRFISRIHLPVHLLHQCPCNESPSPVGHGNVRCDPVSFEHRIHCGNASSKMRFTDTSCRGCAKGTDRTTEYQNSSSVSCVITSVRSRMMATYWREAADNGSFF